MSETVELTAQDEAVEPTAPDAVNLTVEIVSSYVSHNTLYPDDMLALLRSVHKTLSDLANGHVAPVADEPATTEPVELQPAVPVKRSVTPDALTCLVCGEQHKLLKRHLSTAHDMTPADYRQAFSLKPDYPMAAPNYAQQRRDLAMAIGLGRKRAEAA